MPYNPPTAETLLAQAQADVTASNLTGVDGTLAYGLLAIMVAIQAQFAFGHYDQLAYAFRQSNPFTATDEWLEAWAALKQVFRKDATAAGVDGTSLAAFTGAPTAAGVAPVLLPAGSAVRRQDGFGYVTLADAYVDGSGNLSVAIAATTPGVLGNVAAGAVLTLGGGITGLNSGGVASTALTGGAEQEVDQDLRTRMLFAYANPPAGGADADYVRWALEVPGVTRAWNVANGMGAGTTVVFVMLDAAEAAHGGFPQGRDGVAAAETRADPAQGDQLAVANHIYGPGRRPVTALVYVRTPVAAPIAYTIANLAPFTAEVQAGITTALQAMHLRQAALGGTLYPSDWNEAVAAAPGIQHFTIAAPTGPVTAGPGQLSTVGTVTCTA